MRIVEQREEIIDESTVYGQTVPEHLETCIYGACGWVRILKFPTQGYRNDVLRTLKDLKSAGDVLLRYWRADVLPMNIVRMDGIGRRRRTA